MLRSLLINPASFSTKIPKPSSFSFNILRLFNKELQKAANRGAGVDYKSQLQELIQARKQQMPAYRLVKVMGPDHDRRFTVKVKVGDNVLGRGSGRSKKEAETEAARVALEQLTTDFT